MATLLFAVLAGLGYAVQAVQLHEQAEERGLAVVSYWSPEFASKEKAPRIEALQQTLKTLAAYPVPMDIMLVTNEYVLEVADMVAQQVVREKPRCSSTFEDNKCLPWEAIRAMRGASSSRPPWRVTCDLESSPACAPPTYDYYMYLEGDMEIPADTFNFWRAHTDKLFGRGYLLVPHRVEWQGKKLIATDCIFDDCVDKASVLLDDTPLMLNAGLSQVSDQFYLKPHNPYSACWMMTAQQFGQYLQGPMWSYASSHQFSVAPPPVGQWRTRESAAGGLVWDPRFEFGAAKSITHLRMPVIHQLSMQEFGKNHVHPVTHSKAHLLSEYVRKVEECAENAGVCGRL